MENKVPFWANDVLQAISFWLGYKKQIIGKHPLPEAAIVTECLELLMLKLAKAEIEVVPQFEVKAKNGKSNFIDLVLLDKKKRVLSFIEVKRFQTQSHVPKDLQKLQSLKKQKLGIRCFVLLACQAKRPKAFVSSNGNAIKKSQTIPGGGEFRTVRVCKAASGFSSVNRANYVCLLEVQ